MITHVPAIVRNLFPERRSSRLSVAAVRTTREKFLVFDGSARQPAFIVQIGPRDDLVAVDRVLRRLHTTIPDLVPDSLVCVPFDTDRWIHVQTGAPGRPWFRLGDSCRTRRQWLRLLDRSAEALVRLHGAIAGVPDWARIVRPGDELQRQAQRFDPRSSGAAADLGRRVDAAIAALGRAEHKGRCQHGDFALNNLLVSPSSITIIDFDEFGNTAMPLQDAFGLALSFPLSQGEACPLRVRDCIDVCTRAAVGPEPVPPDQTAALFLHHLLWRINQCDGCPPRASVRRTLVAMLDAFVAEPAVFVGSADTRLFARTA